VKEELIGTTVNISTDGSPLSPPLYLKGCKILDIADGLMKIEDRDGKRIWVGVGMIKYIELA